MKNIILAVICLIVGINTTNLLGQQSNCIPNYNPSEWQNDTETLQGSLGLIGSVNFEKRVSGTNIDIHIDWSTLTNASTGLSENAVKELLEYNIARKSINCNHNTTQEFERTVTFYYTTKCTYEKVSIVKLDHDNKVVCCDDPAELQEDTKIYWYNSWYHVHKTIEECGTFQCCRKVYTVRCKLVAYEFQGQTYYIGETEIDPQVTKFVVTQCQGSGVYCPVPPAPLPPLPPRPSAECKSGC